MTDAIVEKLRVHLSEKMDTECKVVYLLCEVRKLLKWKDRLFALTMYCNWAVHVDLSHEKTTKVFLNKLDDYVVAKTKSGESTGTLSTELALFREFIYLDTFRRELAQFLGMHGLPTSLCDEDANWFPFLHAYARVIEDGSLACRAEDGEDTLKIVKKVTFTKTPATSAKGHVPFNVLWTILLKPQEGLPYSALEFEGGAVADPKHIHWVLRTRPEPLGKIKRPR